MKQSNDPIPGVRNVGVRRTCACLARTLSAILMLWAVHGCSSTPDRLDFAEYRGEGRLWEDTQDVYPKYWLLFPTISLDAPGTFQYRVSHLPSTVYYIGLALDSSGSEEERGLFARFGFACDIKITDTYSHRSLEYGGLLVGGPGASSQKGTPRRGFWEMNSLCIENAKRRIYVPWGMGVRNLFDPTHGREYTIQITVTSNWDLGRSEPPPHIVVTPVMWAGDEW